MTSEAMCAASRNHGSAQSAFRWRTSSPPSTQATMAEKFGASVIVDHEPRLALIEALAAWSGGVLHTPILGLPVTRPGHIDVVYDTVGKPDIPGQPNRDQMKLMVQKLLANRFQLRFHIEKKELPVYAMVVAKSGPKITVSAGDPNDFPGIGFGREPGWPGGHALDRCLFSSRQHGPYALQQWLDHFQGLCAGDRRELPVGSQ